MSENKKLTAEDAEKVKKAIELSDDQLDDATGGAVTYLNNEDGILLKFDTVDEALEFFDVPFD
ncbi:MAG: hypothetical protein E7508_03875 [Ruminococcus sp.]|nr:hypothetical protein [Ruminococcus sp.]